MYLNVQNVFLLLFFYLCVCVKVCRCDPFPFFLFYFDNQMLVLASSKNHPGALNIEK